MTSANKVQGPSAGDIRAAIARARIPAYIVGARARINPIRLSGMLNERLPLSAEIAERLMRVIEAEAGTVMK